MNEREFRRKARRSFLVGGAASALGALGFRWIAKSRESGGIAWPIRSVLEMNGRLWQKFYDPDREDPTEDHIDLYRGESENHARLNGDLGLSGLAPDPGSWKLRFETRNANGGSTLHASVSLAALRDLPKVEYVTRFKCIEGWSTNVKYRGVRFSHFLETYGPGPLDSDRYRYVGMETPDRGYYVSIDLPSMLHRQTLLCYEMNDLPLGSSHGAPLRLVIPIKYGIKSLKRVSTVFLADFRPPDYWAERGYDWYAGI
jgi:Oxidoreductase molybdopterin binding domain